MDDDRPLERTLGPKKSAFHPRRVLGTIVAGSMMMTKRLLAFALIALAAAAPAAAQYYFDYPRFSRFEAGAYLIGWRSMKNGQTVYADSWSDRLLRSVYEQTLIDSKASFGLGAGLSFVVYLNRNLGGELLAEAASAPLTTTADMAASWTWADNRTVRQSAVWTGGGRFSQGRICLNAVNRFPGRRMDFAVSGGLSAFLNRFSADSWFGFGISKLSDDGSAQLMDVFKIGLGVPATSWLGIGANLGIGAKLSLTGRIGLKAEIRAFFCPAKELRWSFVQGFYDGYFYGMMLREPFGTDSVAFVNKSGTLHPFMAHPSSLRIGLGLSWSSDPVIEY